MLSFKILLESEICKYNFTENPETTENLSELLSKYGEGNVALCLFSDTALIRIFDNEEYSFLYPCRLPQGKTVEAVDAIAEYAVREEIGLLFQRVPKAALMTLVGNFCYCDVRREDFESEYYTVRMRSEADLMGKAPTVKGDGVTLSALKRKDIPEYAAVCREQSGLLHWGYDYREDEPTASDEYFYNVQLSELYRGVSMTFGVRLGAKLIGEASFYAFDYKGGAEIGFRLLPEYRGRGLGRATLEALLLAAERIGLFTIYATVDKKNLPSLSLISQYMDKIEEKDEIIRFILKGEE